MQRVFECGNGFQAPHRTPWKSIGSSSAVLHVHRSLSLSVLPLAAVASLVCHCSSLPSRLGVHWALARFAGKRSREAEKDEEDTERVSEKGKGGEKVGDERRW
ncbi:hypothetical protein Dimus_038890 [Dionaea muscipula]